MKLVKIPDVSRDYVEQIIPRETMYHLNMFWGCFEEHFLLAITSKDVMEGFVLCVGIREPESRMLIPYAYILPKYRRSKGLFYLMSAVLNHLENGGYRNIAFYLSEKDASTVSLLKKVGFAYLYPAHYFCYTLSGLSSLKLLKKENKLNSYEKCVKFLHELSKTERASLTPLFKRYRPLFFPFGKDWEFTVCYVEDGVVKACLPTYSGTLMHLCITEVIMDIREDEWEDPEIDSKGALASLFTYLIKSAGKELNPETALLTSIKSGYRSKLLKKLFGEPIDEYFSYLFFRL